MQTRGPRIGTPARAAHLCAVTALTSGCTTIDETLVQPLQGVWFIVSLLLTGVIVGMWRRTAWRTALQRFEPPIPPTPGATWWLKGWTPFLVVGAVFVGFALYNFSGNPLPSSPGQQWWNAGAWLIGSVVGAVVGWFVGREVAGWEFRRRYPGQSS